MKSLIPTLALFSAVVLLAGCAISYQNEKRRGLLGFAWVEYRTDGGGENGVSLKVGKETIDRPTPVVQQKTLGFYLDVSENTPGVGFGFRDIIVVVPEVNAETRVDYDTSDPLSSSLNVGRQPGHDRK
jgi:hypothetical protein